MATTYKIHPAIGIARVGNSPNEFFIGPERPHEHPEPQGGFKDGQCRVKRQAARFRIYAHLELGGVEEITDAEAEITWSVHLVNKKAAFPGRGNSESAAALTIDPGERTLTGPNQMAQFDSGQIAFSGVSAVTVPLGEIRSDNENHLLVLGGFGTSASPQGTGIGDFWGNYDWYDDISDGYVKAHIKIRATNDEFDCVGAWVIVGPPKFAPHIDNVVTLYDRLEQVMIDGGFLATPTVTSYTDHVYPILQSARDTRFVEDVGSVHAWVDPVNAAGQRDAIFGRLTAPTDNGTDMPDIYENTPDGRLTPTQYAHMERWKDGNYTDDWAGPPTPANTITPEGLDRAALEHCVGGAFFPGIEAGGRVASERPILETGRYGEAFRLNHAANAPGDISAAMALPWQADFNACNDNWWPVPRPNDVKPQGSSSYLKWDRDVGGYEDMVAKWHTLGFIVKQGNDQVETGRCEEPSITLMTPHLDFVDVPTGPMNMVREVPLSITFEVISPSTAVTLQYAAGGAPNDPQLFAANTSVTVGPTGASQIANARLWVIYRTGAVGSSLPQQVVTVESGSQTWQVTITGNTVARQTTGVALVLDRSYSMTEDRGDGQSKHKSLQEGANIFVDAMLQGDGAGVIRYNQDAQVLQPVVPLGDGNLSDTNRNLVVDAINGNGLDPDGATSIGDGIFEGRGALDAVAGTYDRDAVVVLTDGNENRWRYIADVADQINAHTYAIGLGTPQNTSAAALQTLSGNNGGYLLITGAIDTNNRFLLQKYFMQVLAGINNADIVLDPNGVLVPGQVHRIPFKLTRGDAGVDVILLTPNTKIVDFRLQTPTGLLLEPWRALSEPAMHFKMTNSMSLYRLALPVELQAGRQDHGGTWQALLTIGRPRLEPTHASEHGVDRAILHAAAPVQPRRSLRGRVETARRERASFTAEVAVGSGTSAAVAPGAAGRSVRYSLMVHSYSNLGLRVRAEQSGFDPGATVNLFATLTESGLPTEQPATVWAEVTRPNGVAGNLVFKADEPGIFGARYTTTEAGLYQFRVRASGRTRRGEPFSREQTVTAGVWRGGDHDANNPPTSPGGSEQEPGGGDGRTEPLCELLTCLLREGGFVSEALEKRLRDLGFDLNHLRKCLKRSCCAQQPTVSSLAAELLRRDD